MTNSVMMNTMQVNVRRAGALRDFASELKVAQGLARLMDSQFELGSFRFGLDSLVGLLPVVGDAVALGVGLYSIYLARKYNLGRAVVARMTANLLVDFAGGLVPVLGDAFDVFYKANLKNLRILEAAAKRKKLI